MEIRAVVDSIDVSDMTTTHPHNTHSVIITLSLRFVYKNFKPVGSRLSTHRIRVPDTKPDQLGVCLHVMDRERQC